MRRLLPLFLVVLAASARSAGASGVNLSWNDCGTAGAPAVAFSCDENDGDPFLLYGSFATPEGFTVEHLLSIEFTLDVIPADGGSPAAWWSTYGVGGCRPGAMALRWGAPSSCGSPWNVRPSEFLTGYQVAPYQSCFSPTRGVLTGTEVVPEDRVAALASGVEYRAFTVAIDRSASTGPGACAGCARPACLLLRSVRLVQLPADPEVILAEPITQQIAQWQSNGGPCFCDAARNHTWGTIKTLYR